MGKIAPVSSKYIIHAVIKIEGVVDRPDVIGAVFGQTEGLLGSDLELRELQRSGRIGRIEVTVETRGGKSTGKIIIPSSLDKAETSIVGAALEVIQRIGPCNAKIHVESIEDVRVSKRTFVIQRAKELLKQMMDKVIPDSQELADEVAYSVRVMEITEFGQGRLPAGPAVEESEEIIFCEGRADVLTLLKNGIKNAIAINGTSVPAELAELSKRKIVTAFVDGDRGGKLIIRELMNVADIDYVTFAPDGKEVEELTKKEVHKALRSKISAEQAKHDILNGISGSSQPARKPQQQNTRFQKKPYQQRAPVRSASAPAKKNLTADEKKKFKQLLEDLIGTKGAYILDPQLAMLGKVPLTELASTIKSLKTGVYAVVFDGTIDKELLAIAERIGVARLIAMDSKIRSSSKVGIYTANNL